MSFVRCFLQLDVRRWALGVCCQMNLDHDHEQEHEHEHEHEQQQPDGCSDLWSLISDL
jgi:hypothetical protein